MGAVDIGKQNILSARGTTSEGSGKKGLHSIISIKKRATVRGRV